MKLSTFTFLFFVEVYVNQMYSNGLLLGPLLSVVLLPYTIIFNVAGIAGVKLALAIKLLGFIGWWRSGISENALLREYRMFPVVGVEHGYSSDLAENLPPLDVIPGILKEIVRSMLQDDNVGVGFFQRSGRKNAKVTRRKLNQTSRLTRSVGSGEPGNLSLMDQTLWGQAFDVIHKMNVDDCMLRLACEVGAVPSRYGKYGERVSGFVRELGTVGGNGSSFHRYQAAFKVGQLAKLTVCKRLYPLCRYDLVRITRLVEKIDLA